MFKSLRAKTAADVVAIGLVIMGLIFLLINANILARAAARWADSSLDRASYGLIAFLVPFFIGAAPFVALLVWRRGHRIWSGIVWCVWVIFVVYNIIGSGGAIAMIRSDVVSIRKSGVQLHSNTTDRRARVAQQLDAIPKDTRTSAAIAPQIEAQKTNPWWRHTEGCTDITNARGRKFCAEYRKLETELANASALAQLSAELGSLDKALRAEGPVAAVVDPSAAFIAAYLGIDENSAQNLLPLATPIILEIGTMAFFSLALVLFNLSHGTALESGLGRLTEPRPERQPLRPLQQTVLHTPLPRPVMQTPISATKVSAGKSTALWFFAEATRPTPSGNLDETDWYAHYRRVMEAMGEDVLSLHEFRQIAASYVSVVEVDGRVWYRGAMPIPPTIISAGANKTMN